MAKQGELEASRLRQEFLDRARLASHLAIVATAAVRTGVWDETLLESITFCESPPPRKPFVVHLSEGLGESRSCKKRDFRVKVIQEQPNVFRFVPLPDFQEEFMKMCISN
jgi:hypothetical protein